MIGTVDIYNRERGYGFIISREGGRVTYFFHASEVLEGFPALDSVVEFDPAPAKKGTNRPSAVRVRVKAGV